MQEQSPIQTVSAAACDVIPEQGHDGTMPIIIPNLSVARNSFLLAQVSSLPEGQGTAHPQQADTRKRLDIKKRQADSQNRGEAKRFKSNYEWRGQDFVYAMAGKCSKIAAKFPHLSGRPPE